MPSQGQGKRRLNAHDVPIKRFRVSRACDQCRTAREKCDGNQPICEPCIEAKRGCTYTSNPKKRGLQPGYIRSLEMTLAYIFQHNSDIETLVNNQLAEENTILLAKGTKESNRLHKSWTKSKFCRGITRTLAGEQAGSSDEKAPSEDEDSEVDTEDASLLRMDPDARAGAQQPPWTQGSGYSLDAQNSASVWDGNPSVARPLISSSELVPLPTDCWKLLDAYSTYTQCWLPISEKLDVLKLSYSYPEEGLPLSPIIADAGNHAEMWSIFALGSTQDHLSASEGRALNEAASTHHFYSVAKRLLPDELGKFELSHVKALLNLAVLNIGKSRFEAAWQLVGAASRIFLALDQSTDLSDPRRKNVLASCFLLDSLLSLHLDRRPYLNRSDIAISGKIEEDGMEEWQPWNGTLKHGVTGQSRTPTLALSSFNSLLEVVDILSGTTRQSTARNYLHEMIGRLEVWKTSLPSKLDYIRSDSAAYPMTPPAVLLQLTYLTTVFALVPSLAWLQRIVTLLSTLGSELGFTRLPPIILCLLKSIKRCSTNVEIDRTTHIQLHNVFTDIDRAFADVTGDTRSNASALQCTSPGVTQLRSQELNQISPGSVPSRVGDHLALRYQQGSSSLLDDLLPDMNPNHHGGTMDNIPSRSLAHPFDPSALESSALDPLDSYNAFMAGDLESFFDDLASIHGAKKLQNQPQFMQNLGYSSEVSMADLLATDPGRFMPLPTSSTFDHESSDQSPHFPLNTYYDVG
ncbi:hypothetical protein NX059_000483 [Plenodomus lindquistii]|nr:hypothetical protein NX059_000483 [Plenodomus lindquistii]